MHFAMGFDIVVQFDDARFFRSQNGANFVKRPSEVVTIIIQ